MIKRFMWVFLFTIAMDSVWAGCPELDTMIRPDDGLVPKLAFGADLDREVTKQMSCLNVTERFLDGGTATISSSVLSGFSDVFEKLMITAGGEVSFAKIFTAKASALYEKIFKETKFGQSFVLAYDITFGTLDATLNSNDPLNSTGKATSTDACVFKKYCGNNYVCQAKQGANISVKLDFEFTSEYHKNEFKANASAGIAGLKICCIPFSLGFSAEIQKLSESTRRNGMMRLEAIQNGGRVEQLSRILGGNVFSCSLDNLAACTAALDAIATYVASNDFILGVRELPQTTDYKYCPYEAVYGVPSLPNEATPAVQNARQQLAEKYRELLSDRQALMKTLSLSLSASRRQQLDSLLVMIDSDAELVRQTGELCLNDLTNCPQKTAQVFSGLKAYDRAVVNPNPSDGLVAYYPFNANALDESGNGNDGVVYGATLTADRNGKANSAYRFNGVNSYINIGHNPILNVNYHSILAWIRVDSFSTYNFIISKVNSGIQYSSFDFGLNEGMLRTNFTNPEETTICCHTIKDSTKLSEGIWHLAVMTYNGKNIDFYIDGILSGSQPRTGNLNTNTNDATIGSQVPHDPYPNPFNGVIDDLRIYNRALTDAEIQQLYIATNLSANQPPLAMFTTSTVQGAAPLTVNVDASTSADTDGSISSYNWQTSNGQTAIGKTASFTFNNSGTYTITLTVTDDKGATSQAQKTVTVEGGTVCTQVITYAKNPVTGECQAFGTPCDVPSGWTACQQTTDSDKDGIIDNVDNCPLISNASGYYCGGIAGFQCPTEYTCAYNSTNGADYLGICQKDTNGNGIGDACDTSTNTVHPSNISTRSPVKGGANNTIAGFIIQGTGYKKVFIKAEGAGLASRLPTGSQVLSDAKVVIYQLVNGTWQIIATNDNWQTDSNASQIPANMQLTNTTDAGLLRDLPAGVYTAIVQPATTSTTLGIALVSVNDLDNTSTSTSKLVNISTRAPIESGAGQVIAGFVISGTGTQNVVITARGKSVNMPSGLCQDPSMTVHQLINGSWTQIASNDNWQTDAQSNSIPPNLQPTDANDSALYMSLSASPYTAIMSCKTGTGVGLIGVDTIN